MKHILVIEDEQDIYELLRFNLMREGYEVAYAPSGEEGLKKALASSPDLVILDLMLPGMDGIEVCKRLRAENQTRAIPIVMLTAKDEDIDIVTGLEVGADHYITKPFSPRVVVAHVRALLRRRPEEVPVTDEPLVHGELEIDAGRRRVLVAGTEVSFTASEFRLLYALAKRPGWVFSRSQLIDEMRGEDVVISDRAVDVQVAAVRKKLGTLGSWIETVRGAGYRMKEA